MSFLDRLRVIVLNFRIRRLEDAIISANEDADNALGDGRVNDFIALENFMQDMLHEEQRLRHRRDQILQRFPTNP